MVGTRGVPAHYGGFETAVEEVGRRLVERGHDVVVYCRDEGQSDDYLGMRLVHLPAVRKRSLETLSHTLLSTAHLVAHRTDVAIVFNAANAPFLPVLRLAGIPAAVHVDGLEWQRAKWEGWGRRYYRLAESSSVRWGRVVIADAEGIAVYLREEYGTSSRLISYGAPILPRRPPRILGQLGLESNGYHLVVARFEPENHVALILRGYRHSKAALPLVVVGSSPYGSYGTELERIAETDGRIRMVGPVWNQDLLDELYANAASYIHGHSVGGTNPSLLRAMGAGAPVIAYDVVFNREVAGDAATYFTVDHELASRLESTEADPHHTSTRAELGRDRAERLYRWDDVADRYEKLCFDLAALRSPRRAVRAHRTEARTSPAGAPRAPVTRPGS
jgi:glycosyltransferase involved in cell wall biosynthesis